LVDEELVKLLAHNLCCPISAWYELGIEPVFGGEPEEQETILRFPG
jgi:hypothetical protein